MIPNEYLKNLYRASLLFLIILSLFFAVKVLSEFRSYSMLGSNGANVITLSGHGEITAVPDIANISFTISRDAKTAKEAQTLVAQVEKKALDFLKNSNVADRDIKTTNAAVYPKYEYSRSICPTYEVGTMGSSTKNSMPIYCPPGKQVIVGYTASESVTVKIRKVDDTGEIMQGLGVAGVSDLNGPNFAIDNEDSLKAQARKKAIDDAQQKARVLARDLGVHLGRIAGFSESGNYGGPIMYGKAVIMSADSAPSTPAQIPKGENIISSDVSITYEIR